VKEIGKLNTNFLDRTVISLATNNSPTRLPQKGGWLGVKGLWPQMTITDPPFWNSAVFPIHFWATISKTVRPMLPDRSPVCPVLSVCL